MTKTCQHDGCDAPHHAKGYCKTHYLRVWRHGTPTPTTARLTPVQAFWARVEKQADGCWLWTGGLGHGGYGQVGARVGITPSGSTIAHRVAWELTNGPIPEGLHLDHLCRVPLCVNPAHLEPVTVAENTRRGLHGVLRTHCMRGHELTPENTYVRPSDGSRRCRTCIRDEGHVSRRARRAGRVRQCLAENRNSERCTRRSLDADYCAFHRAAGLEAAA